MAEGGGAPIYRLYIAPAETPLFQTFQSFKTPPFSKQNFTKDPSIQD